MWDLALMTLFYKSLTLYGLFLLSSQYVMGCYTWPLSSTVPGVVPPISSIHSTTCQRWPVPIIFSTPVTAIFDGRVSCFVCFKIKTVLGQGGIDLVFSGADLCFFRLFFIFYFLCNFA
jgi:hypothetical protein